MRKNIIYSILFVSLFISSLYIVNYIVDTGASKTKSNDFNYYFGVWGDIYASRINADLVFSGSSRTYINVSPKICDSMLHINTYNLGIDGWDFSMEYVRFKIYLQHNIKPKYVVQNIDFELLEYRDNLFEFIQFVPFLNDPMIYDASQKYTGAFTWADRYFPLYKYNNQSQAIKDGIRSYFHLKPKVKSQIYKGHFERDEKWGDAFDKFKKKYPNGVNRKVPESAKTDFESFLVLCKNNDIKVIFDFAPVYYEEMKYENSKNELMSFFNSMSQKYNVPILDYTQDSLCYDKKYFYNSQHLNKDGSRIFSVHLATDLKKIIEQH